MKVILGILLGILLVLATLTAFALLGSIPLWLLWNWLMPIIFGLPELTWLQSLGMLLLTSILFKSTSSSND